jgi:DNA-binding transcriptional ArsR family regulator
VGSASKTSPTEDASPSQDAVFEVLSNERRRYVVHALRERESPVELGPLAEQIAAWENDTSVTDVTYDQRKRVYTALQQSHLPKMENAGAVEFDKDRGTIVPSDELSEFDLYLEIVPNTRRPHTQYYLGLTAVSLVVSTLVVLDLGPFVYLTDIVWALVLTLLFGVTAGIDRQTSHARKIGPDR